MIPLPRAAPLVLAVVITTTGGVHAGLSWRGEGPHGDAGTAPRTGSAGGALRLAETRRVRPQREGVRTPLEFPGPGRDEPEPDVTEVVIAWFGPGDPDHPDFGSSWRGALLALDEENAAGGYRRRGAAVATASAGKPYRLAPAWSESPWQAGIADLLRVVYDRLAWAVIGGVDGATTHLAVQVALKSRFLLLSPGSTDVTADRANVPWLFSIPPSDEAVAPVIVRALTSGGAGAGGCAVVAASDHDSHAMLVAIRRELDRRKVSPVSLLEVDPATADPDAAASHVLKGRPGAILVLAPPRLAGRLVASLRLAGFRGTIVGGAQVASSAFRTAAGDAADGVLVPLSIERGARWEAFAAAYEKRWGTAPDVGAVHGYDAVRLTVAAIGRAGLNRPRIRDAVRALAPWPGAGGVVSWDPLGRNQRPTTLGRWTRGRLVTRGDEVGSPPRAPR